MDLYTVMLLLFFVFVGCLVYSLVTKSSKPVNASAATPSPGAYPKNVFYEDDYQKAARLSKLQPKPSEPKSYRTPPPVVRETYADYCRILGVSPTEKDLTIIKRVYIQKIRKTHPDAMVNATPEQKNYASIQATDINRAYTYIEKYYKKK